MKTDLERDFLNRLDSSFWELYCHERTMISAEGGPGFFSQHLSSPTGSEMWDPVIQKDSCHSGGAGLIFPGGLPAGLG